MPASAVQRLALSSELFSEESGHSILPMITSADNPRWPMDVAIYAASAGLQSASKIRKKLFTLDNRLVLRKLGVLSEADQHKLVLVIKRLLAVSRSRKINPGA